ncbi:MAG: hypothetical protein ACTHJ9_17315 [Rhodanobacter sp.]
MKLFSKLLHFLLLRVVDDGAGDPPAGDPNADLDGGGDPAGGGDDFDDGLGDLDDDAGTPPVGTRSAPRTPSDDRDDRLARLEQQVSEAQRRYQEAVSRTPPTTPQQDPEWQREEERLRAADVTDLERWQIQSNRTLRETRATAAQAVMHAQDTADRANFQSKFSTDPRRSKYADRVEQEITSMRQKGQNAPRETVYYYMLGKDIAEGKLKAKPKAPPADLPRGRTPNARTDVSGRSGKSDHQKRAERLANIQI